MDAADVQHQINQTIPKSNNEVLSQFSSIMDSRVYTVQQNINETQKVIAELQEAWFEVFQTVINSKNAEMKSNKNISVK